MTSRYSLPIDFLVVGAQRCGTTSLYHLLRGHPELFLPETKELQFFTNNYHLGATWYSQHFQSSRSIQRVGEITPYYLFHPYAPARISSASPSLRIIILLRDPVSRVVSHYQHSRRWGFERLPLVFALAAERGRLIGADDCLARPGGRHFAHQELSYVSRSRYYEQIARYLDYFSKDQILLVRSEDLFCAPARACDLITAFLGVGPHPDPSSLPRLGATKPFNLSQATREFLEEELACTYALMEQDHGLCW